jgi:hypothetical protein
MTRLTNAHGQARVHEGEATTGHSCQKCRPADPHGNRAQRREAARLAKRGVCWCKTDDDGRMVRTGCPSHHAKDEETTDG